MRISMTVATFAAMFVMVQPAHAQAKGKAKMAAKPAAAAPAPAMAASSAPLAGRWEGTYTSDVTSKGGKLVLTLNGSDESATGQLMLTPTGGRTISAEGAAAPMEAPAKGKKAAPAPAMSGGLSVTASKASDDKVSGTIDGAYMDPGCNCTVVSTFEGELNGNTLTGTISARDSRTGQWNFSSFTATKGGAPAKR